MSNELMLQVCFSVVVHIGILGEGIKFTIWYIYIKEIWSVHWHSQVVSNGNNNTVLLNSLQKKSHVQST